MNDSMFVEFDPIGNPAPSAQQPGRVAETVPIRPLGYFADQTPYTYSCVADQGALPQSGVQISSQGNVYDCVKMQTGLQNKCDTVFWMAPGRPQDMGSKWPSQTNPAETGVWKQARSIGSNISAAGSAPYSGLYTGLSGYIEQVSQE